VAASIKEFGWTNPILAGADDEIIAGHERLLAAQLLGSWSVPSWRPVDQPENSLPISVHNALSLWQHRSQVNTARLRAFVPCFVHSRLNR
jgi:hypothetical protein